ncbi:MAG: selenocysteine-specific translation elongation factor [Chloroflexus sp.]|nr:selenocysteine-specific translation elongation factor [Chloroflexus sp.]
MFIIGTAGHVDHGKSTLVKALTGIDPDRLLEEKQREMTIDLGFAWLTLPSGREVSLVDVPGHERFIKNMLAGVGGIDAVLLVIAADEAVMPQTREHLAIIDLLDIRYGIVVLSKIDLVDHEWLALVSDEVRAALAGSTLATAPIVPISARTGVGLAELAQALDRLLDTLPARHRADGIPRLAIDRSFAISGFGTVVTGVLRDGSLSVGQEVEILPQGLRARIRGLQSHQRPLEQALPGTRVAVNLAGIHYREVGRGDVLAVPGALAPTTLLDAQIRVVGDAPPLRHNTALDLFIGSSEAPCRLALLAADELAPGEQGWAQLRLAKPVVAVAGDRFILRIPSPSQTVAGGVVVDPHPPRHRRFRAEVIAALALRMQGSPAERLLQALADGRPRLRAEVVVAAGVTELEMATALPALLANGQVVTLGNDGLISAAGWSALRATLCAALASYHQRFPLRRGMPREEARQRVQAPARLWPGIVATALAEGLIGVDDTTVRLADFVPQPTAGQRRQLDLQLAAMARNPYAPPSLDLDGELLAWALDQGLLVKIAPDLYLLPAIYAEMVAWVRSTIETRGSLTVAELRDHFGISRRYAVALLEHLDERRITRRQGDRRVLG